MTLWKGSYPGGSPGLQNRRGALDVPGGFDSHPFPPGLMFEIILRAPGDNSVVVNRYPINRKTNSIAAGACRYSIGYLVGTIA